MLIRFGSDADPTCMQMDEVRAPHAARTVRLGYSLPVNRVDPADSGFRYSPVRVCLLRSTMSITSAAPSSPTNAACRFLRQRRTS